MECLTSKKTFNFDREVLAKCFTIAKNFASNSINNKGILASEGRQEAWQPFPKVTLQEPLVVKDKDGRQSRGHPGGALLLYMRRLHCWEVSLG